MKIRRIFIIGILLTVSLMLHSQNIAETIVTASSTLSPSSSSNFYTENLIDGTSASWSEGAKGNGIGEYFLFDFKYPDKMEFVMIKNGFGKQKYYEKNARIKKLKISDSNGKSRILELADSPEMKIYGLREMNSDDAAISFGEALEGESFKFEILEVYSGSRWQDACLTEIGINKWYYENFELSDSYICKNLLKEHLEAIFDGKGEVYEETDYDGYYPAEIEDGFHHSEIVSGDGTEGFHEAQVFINRMTDNYYLLSSSFVSQLNMEPLMNDGKGGDAPARLESFYWSFYQYDKQMNRLNEFNEGALLTLFDVAPLEKLAETSGEIVNADMIWVYRPEPGFISVVLKESTDDQKAEITYYWDENFFRLQE